MTLAKSKSERACWAIYNNLVKMGYKGGVPDLSLVWRSHDYCGLYLELKKKGAKPDKRQKAFLDHAATQGYMATWSDNVDESIEVFDQYLN